jgi:hypothetical protein
MTLLFIKIVKIKGLQKLPGRGFTVSPACSSPLYIYLGEWLKDTFTTSRSKLHFSTQEIK